MHEKILQNISRFITLDEKETEIFTSMLHIKTLKKRQYLLQEGDISRNEYFVNKGCLRAYYIDTSGIEHVVQFAIEDWWINDMYSFIAQKPARYTIDALEDSEVVYFDRTGYDQIFEKIPKFERFFRLLLQNAFVVMQERIIANMSQQAEERYLDFIEKYPAFEQRIPQHQVASFLGITPESLSRIRKKLSAKH